MAKDCTATYGQILLLKKGSVFCYVNRSFSNTWLCIISEYFPLARPSVVISVIHGVWRMPVSLMKAFLRWTSLLYSSLSRSYSSRLYFTSHTLTIWSARSMMMSICAGLQVFRAKSTRFYVDFAQNRQSSGEIDVFWVGFRPKSGGHHDWDRLFRDSWVLRCGEFSRKISSTEASPWETL